MKENRLTEQEIIEIIGSNLQAKTKYNIIMGLDLNYHKNSFAFTTNPLGMTIGVVNPINVNMQKVIDQSQHISKLVYLYLIEGIVNIAKNAWSYEPNQQTNLVKNIQKLSTDTYSQTLKARDILETELTKFNNGQGEFNIIENSPLTPELKKQKPIFDTELGLDYEDCNNKLEALHKFMNKIKELDPDGTKYYIPGLEYYLWALDKNNYNDLPVALKDKTKYFFTAGTWFRDRYGDSVLPALDPKDAYFRPNASYLSCSWYAINHFFVLERI